MYLGSRNAERGAKAVEEVKKSSGESVELLTIVSFSVCHFVMCFHAFDDGQLFFIRYCNM